MQPTIFMFFPPNPYHSLAYFLGTVNRLGAVAGANTHARLVQPHMHITCTHTNSSTHTLFLSVSKPTVEWSWAEQLLCPW